jgi:hypothetical protein
MSRTDPSVRNELVSAVEECRKMLSGRPEASAGAPAAPLPSLLEQVNALLGERETTRGPLSTLHHFACTGGTLIARCLAVMPNACVLSEVDPLSTYTLDKRYPSFAPTDLIRHLRYSLREVDGPIIAEAYLAALDTAKRGIDRSGVRLIIRDHTHSHYCVGTDPRSRRSHRALLQERFALRSIVTVRDPVESYVSLGKMNSVSFEPKTLEEYCRRYLLFLDDHADLPLYRYEDFVADPEAVMRAMTRDLGLAYRPGFESLIGPVAMTGDSGRKGGQIAPRPPKPRSAELEAEVAASTSYQTLKQRLGY